MNCIYIYINSNIKCMYIPIYAYITVLHCPTCCKGFLWFLPNCLCTASPCRTLDSYPCPLENLPVFVRAGAIIPMWPQLDYVGQKTVDVLTKPQILQRWIVASSESPQFTLLPGCCYCFVPVCITAHFYMLQTPAGIQYACVMAMNIDIRSY